ncbi:hypothetical protein [Sandaracinus amylolyticus]|uniref:Uncharacterized protein n=1 Tax=Sandaracinus amylolyticus TaxID=927083 RepID=A0A0F6W3X4_9BACT|nr:hypothetical protein [Sandaracinus amylolyticus]AKF06856.1 hypothetical protein DB32_004005 [Sandaracinus amylolyticus]
MVVSAEALLARIIASWNQEEDVGARYAAKVADVGAIPLMVAAMATKSTAKPVHGAEHATAFVWTTLAYADWIEVTRRVLALPHAWYHLMWFALRYLRVDFVAMARAAGASEVDIARFEREQPVQVVLIAQPEEESLEWEVIAATGRDPRELWRGLREQGAPSGRVKTL